MFKRLVLARPIATLATIIIFGIGCSLGNWQLNRMQQKLVAANDLVAKGMENPILANSQKWELSQVLHRQIIARGTFLADKTVWLENRPHPQGQDPNTGIASGFYVLTPMQLENSSYIVWINRGWAPRDMFNRAKLPNIVNPLGVVEVHGLAFESAPRVMDIGSKNLNSAPSQIEQNLDLNKQAVLLGGVQLPFVIRQDASDELDGLSRDWPAPDSGAEKHEGYAFQWFALAFVALLFWFISGLKRKDLE